MINKDDFYLKDIELCKQLAPIMAKKGIREDGYLTYREGNKTGAPVEMYPHAWMFSICSTYRKDSLEAALPEWCKKPYPAICFDDVNIFWKIPEPHVFEEECDEIGKEIHELLLSSITTRGQSSLTALAQLIILLEKENIL